MKVRGTKEKPIEDLYFEKPHPINFGHSARTTEWHNRLQDVWLHLLRKAGLSASKETLNLLLDSDKT